jgi:hypothetical protein
LNIVTVNGKRKINNTYDDIIDVIKLLLGGAAFDEQWYLATYPDVAEAVEAGIYASGRQHFVEVGYFEGRRPQEFVVDEEWYLKTYPDVAEAIAKGEVESTHQHYNEHGYHEGRLPAGQ